jgi:hypothetical protein
VNSHVDLCCAVKAQSGALNFTSKAGIELTKKNITVFDSSSAAIELIVIKSQINPARPIIS